MPEVLTRLVLAVEERRGDEPPVPVTRVEWGADEMPSRGYFMAALEAAYGSIELPYFPHRVRVEMSAPFRSMSFEASEPQDQDLAGTTLWNAVVLFGQGRL